MLDSNSIFEKSVVKKYTSITQRALKSNIELGDEWNNNCKL